MTFYIVLFLLICGVLLMVTITGKDFYPFSHYPMFSGLNHINKVKVYRLALEAKNGEIEWWQHEAYRYPQIVGNKLYRFYHKLAISDEKLTIPITLNRNKLLLEVIRLIEQEGCRIEKYQAFHVVERTVNNSFEIIDKTVEIILFTDLKNGKIS